MMILMVLILLNLQVQHTIASDEAFIKVTRFQVPPVVLMGANSIRLSCNYELRDETLHAMKLFKDDKEFYRYTPTTRREDQKMSFPVRGITVDLSRSNENTVTLTKINRHTGGLFKCQVSVENTFRSVSAERRLKVEDRTSTNNINNSNRANAESLLSQGAAQLTYQQQQQQQQNNNRQLTGFSSRPSSDQANSGSSSELLAVSQFQLKFAQLLALFVAHLIFQSSYSAQIRLIKIRPD